MKDLFKKYAFVFIAGIFFIIIIIGYSIYQFNSQTPTKTVDGAQVVYSLDNVDKTADQVYDYYYKSIGDNVMLNAFTNAVIDEYEETTKDMKKTAETNANNLILYYQQNYGSSYEEQILNGLRGMGYSSIDDLAAYYVRMEKYSNLLNEYLLANPTSEMSDYQDKQGRVVSHILVKMSDSSNPTEEELAKVDEIEKALQSGEEFASVAAKYSDDSSAAQGGNLGAMNSDTSFVSEFLEAALALNPNEMTTDWVKTEYGWHLIKCDSTDMIDLLDGGLRETILQNDPSIVYKAVWQVAQTKGVSFNDDATKEVIESVFAQYTDVNSEPETTPTETPVESEAPVESEVPSETIAPTASASAQ